MKKFIAGLVMGIVAALALPSFAADQSITEPVPVVQEKAITLVVNGQEITLPDAQPRVVDGQVVVPVVAFSQVAGFDVAWDEASRTLAVTTPKQVTAERPAAVTAPITVTVDGLTYYESNSVIEFLVATFPDKRIAMGNKEIRIGDTYYDAPGTFIGRRSYKDLRHLVQSGVITQDQLDAYYGK